MVLLLFQTLPHGFKCLGDTLVRIEPLAQRWSWLWRTGLYLGTVGIVTLGTTVDDTFTLPVGDSLAVTSGGPVIMALHVTAAAYGGRLIETDCLTQ
jgi:hypothetical protein